MEEKCSNGKLPTLQILKSENEKLLDPKKKAQKNIFTTGITKKNWILSVPISALGQQHSKPAHKQKREDIS